MGGIKKTSADNWFSLYIRCRDNWTCQRCGRVYHYNIGGDNTELQGLHCAHCFGRGGKSTRFEPDNCLALCYGCHSHIDSNPEEKRDLFIKRLGDERYEELRLQANTPLLNAKRVQKDIAKKFKAIFEEMLSGQA